MISAQVPITLVGESVGVKGGGLLEHLLHSLEIQCKPGDLPEVITHDVSNVDVGESVKVSELDFPDGVSSKMDGNVLVALVAKSRASISADAGGGGEAAAEGEAEGEGEAAAE